MSKPYSQDLRERVIAAVDSGIGAYAAAPLFRVSVSYIYKVLGRRRSIGEIKAPLGRAGRKPKLASHDEALRARVTAIPDSTLEELQAWLATERRVDVSIGCLWNRLRRLKLPLKKRHARLSSGSRRIAPQFAIDDGPCQALLNVPLNAEPNQEYPVAMDETDAVTTMA